jgi:hypothetical protein
MNKTKLACIVLMTMTGITAKAGGLLTNTNQNIAFLRNPARDGAIGIDGTYSNPAGVAWMEKGLHLSFNVQNAYQTRTINSGLTVPSLQGTPYYQPYKLNGGDDNGVKTFKGTASAPIVPSIQAALNYDKWGFQASFAITGGGGKATFDEGLGSFESAVAMVPALLYSMGYNQSSAPGYSVKSYIYGRQYVYGLQVGATYKLTDYLAAYVGARFNYIQNKYEGSITNISANIDGTSENLYSYFGDKASTYKQMAFYYQMRASEMTDATQKATYEKMAAAYTTGATKATAAQEQFADKYLDCTQTGWGITPIIGFDFKWKNLNIGTRLEFTTKFNIQNNTKRDDTGLFTDGVNTPNDLPGIVTIGAQYSILPSLRVSAGYHYFFDKDARMDKGKQKLLDGNTEEFLAGAEYDINKIVQISAGIQKTNYKLGNGAYLNDMSFTTSSYSVGFGAGFQLSKKAKLNVAYFWTTYDTFHKEYTQDMTVSSTTVTVNKTDDFSRTNKVFGVGLDLDI